MGRIEHLFLEKDNFVLTVAEGEISDDKFLEHIAILNESEKLHENYRGIVDCRSVSTVATPSSDTIFKAGHFEGGSEKPRKVAVLSSNELIYGLVRMYDAYTPHAEMEVFSEVSRAVEWLEAENLNDNIRSFYEDLSSQES